MTNLEFASSRHHVLSLRQREFAQLFPRLSALVGVEQTKRWVQMYDRFLSDQKIARDWEAFENFRRFPLFLRHELYGNVKARPKAVSGANSVWIDLAQLEWAEFSALYSPANEPRLRKSLGASEVAIHPTVQMLHFSTDLEKYFERQTIAFGATGESPAFVSELKNGISHDQARAEQGEKLLFVYRVGPPFQIRHVIGVWWMGAIIDSLLEHGRMSREKLLYEITAHHGPGHEAAWLDAITKLEDAGLLLKH